MDENIAIIQICSRVDHAHYTNEMTGIMIKNMKTSFRYKFWCPSYYMFAIGKTLGVSPYLIEFLYLSYKNNVTTSLANRQLIKVTLRLL